MLSQCQDNPVSKATLTSERRVRGPGWGSLSIDRRPEDRPLRRSLGSASCFPRVGPLAGSLPAHAVHQPTFPPQYLFPYHIGMHTRAHTGQSPSKPKDRLELKRNSLTSSILKPHFCTFVGSSPVSKFPVGQWATLLINEARKLRHKKGAVF